MLFLKHASSISVSYNKELKEKIEGSKTEEKPSIDELNELKDTLQNLEEEYE